MLLFKTTRDLIAIMSSIGIYEFIGYEHIKQNLIFDMYYTFSINLNIKLQFNKQAVTKLKVVFYYI